MYKVLIGSGDVRPASECFDTSAFEGRFFSVVFPVGVKIPLVDNFSQPSYITHSIQPPLDATFFKHIKTSCYKIFNKHIISSQLHIVFLQFLKKLFAVKLHWTDSLRWSFKQSSLYPVSINTHAGACTLAGRYHKGNVSDYVWTEKQRKAFCLLVKVCSGRSIYFRKNIGRIELEIRGLFDTINLVCYERT